ncbi:MAG: glycosyltransferase family 9 protein, partial [Chitinophagia bacterium]|nr:glycosyltransferase family 9 protein [Chitinophagia bacterium]
MVRSILFIQTAFIGDVVLATSLLEKWHAAHPDDRIDMLVRKGNEALLHDHPFLNEVLVWDKKRGKLRNLLLLLRTVRSHRYDIVVNVQRFLATGLLTAFSGAQETVGFDRNPLSRLFTRRVRHASDRGGAPLHEVERNQRLIAHHCPGPAALPRLHPSESDYEAVRGYQTQPYLCLAPSSVWFTKQYPEEKWVSFLRQVPEGFHIVLIAGPGDSDLCERIRASAGGGDRIRNLAGRLTYLQSAALQQGARMNFVNDSAPLHFASALNAPVTAVFCSTIPAFGYGPL